MYGRDRSKGGGDHLKEIAKLKGKLEKDRKAYDVSLKETKKVALDFAVEKYKGS